MQKCANNEVGRSTHGCDQRVVSTMNILMTGATGFLGSNLLRRLVEDGHDVTILIRQSSQLSRIANILNRVSVHRVDIDQGVFVSSSIETIIHCATNYGRGNVDFAELLEANLLLPLQLLQDGCRAGVRCFINTDTILDKGVNDYTLSKSQFREWFGKYANKMVCVNVALEHFYGPQDDPTKFVSFIVDQLLNDVDSISLTPGEQKRDFIYIDDIVEAFLLILKNSATMKSGYLDYEIGTGQTVSIREFVELIKRLAGNTHTRLDFGALPYRENEAMETHVNAGAIRALGWHPTISLIDGLSKMIELEREAKTE